MQLTDIDAESEYAKGWVLRLQAATTLLALRLLVSEYKCIMNDAYTVVYTWDEFTFKLWRGALKRETQGQPMLAHDYNRKFRTVLMPELLLRVAQVAVQQGLTWGNAYFVLRGKGLIFEDCGVAQFVPPAKVDAQ